MELKELKELLESAIGKNKVAYRAFPEGKAPKLPFICYLVSGTDNFVADSKVYEKRTEVDIELYTAIKDVSTEDVVEEALNDASIIWDKAEEYLDDEQCYEIIYTVII